METKKTTLLDNGLLWFGAAVSIAEIFTGTLFAPLGLSRGLAAIILGHVIGCFLLYLAGLIGANRKVSAMESVRISFGHKGSMFFSFLNILQLLGWTAVMIIGGAKAIGVLVNPALNMQGELLWCLVIGLLIMVWIGIGIRNLGRVNLVAVGALFVLTIVLSMVVFRGQSTIQPGEAISFGAAVELSAAMPLSWLPLISDYTRQAEKPRAAAFISTASYFLGSCWMYLIGLGAALYTGSNDIAQIMLRAGLGLAGVLIVILSTVTTTFLDVYSAGVSFRSISTRFGEKGVALLAAVLGTLLAMFTPIEQYESFLYLIGSVFAPMVAILITDFYILRKDHTKESLNLTNLFIWLAGFFLYREFMSLSTIVGSTLPVMVIISILTILLNGGKRLCSKVF